MYSMRLPHKMAMMVRVPKLLALQVRVDWHLGAFGCLFGHLDGARGISCWRCRCVLVFGCGGQGGAAAATGTRAHAPARHDLWQAQGAAAAHLLLDRSPLSLADGRKRLKKKRLRFLPCPLATYPATRR